MPQAGRPLQSETARHGRIESYQRDGGIQTGRRVLIPAAESGFPIEDGPPDRIVEGGAVGSDRMIDFDDSEESLPDNSDIASRAFDSLAAREHECDALSRSLSLTAPPRIGVDLLTARKTLFYRPK